MIRNAIKLIAQRMLLESGVDLHFHAVLTGCVREDSRITHVIFGHQKRSQGAGGKICDRQHRRRRSLRYGGVPMQEIQCRFSRLPCAFVSAAWIRTLWS